MKVRIIGLLIFLVFFAGCYRAELELLKIENQELSIELEKSQLIAAEQVSIALRVSSEAQEQLKIAQKQQFKAIEAKQKVYLQLVNCEKERQKLLKQIEDNKK